MYHRKIDKALKAKWLAALRDAKRKQTQGQLRDKKGMCCMGVLCDVKGGGQWNGDTWVEDSMSSAYMLRNDSLAKINMSPHTQDKLTKMNDKQDKTFPEIADWVEKHL